MAYTIEIKGVDKTSLLVAGSLRVVRRADHRNSCSLTIKTTAASYVPDVGYDLKVKDSGTVIFGGIIQTATIKRPGTGTTTSTTILIDITSDGYNSLAQRRTLNVQFDNVTAEDVIDYCLAYLADEGVTKGTVDTGASLVEYDAVCKPSNVIFDEMAEASGYKWYINDSKAFQFYQEDSVSAAEHEIEIGGAFTDYNIIQIEKTLDEYANKIFLRGALGDDGVQVTWIEEDSTEQAARVTSEGGGSGVYGLVVHADNVDNATDAETSAENELKKRSRIPTKIVIESHTLDWTAGKKLTVNLPILSIPSDTYFLVEEVVLEDMEGKNLVATLTATLRNENDFSTQRTQTGIDYFSKIVNNSQGGAGGSGSIVTSALVKDYFAANAAQVTVDNSEDTIVTKDITLFVKSDIKILFSCSGAASDALTMTFKTYLDAAAQTYQPVEDIGGADDRIFTYMDTLTGKAAGDYTITVKGVTSANNFVIPASFARLNVMAIPNITGLILSDVAGFTLTVIDDDEIDATWSNPAALHFTGVELYRHTADLAGKTRAWCDSNATEIYDGTNESYDDTGRDPLTTYYYRVFTTYNDGSGEQYSTGVSKSAKTLAAPPTFVSATTNTAGTVITATFSKTMADPSGKHAQFEADDGATNAITAAALNATTTKIDLTVTRTIDYGDTVTLDYTKGTVLAADGGILASFTNQAVTNAVPAPGPTKVYVYGGINGGVRSQDCDEYDQSGNSWSSKTDTPTPARSGLAASTISSKGYIYGGETGSVRSQDCDEYDQSGNSWSSKADMPSPGRRNLAASTISTKGYTYGGHNGTNRLQDCDEYDQSGNSWSSKTDMPSPTRQVLAASTISTKGYVYAGYDSSFLKDCDEYDQSGNSWSSKTDLPNPARYYLAGSTIETKGYVYSGDDSGGRIKDCDEYDQSGNSWSSKADIIDYGRYGLAASTISTKGYTFGGYYGGDLRDCDEYDQSGNSWSNKTDMPSPARVIPAASSI
jgi:kelch-like protein 17 (actinfilin)/kelch-like protein 18